MKIEFDQLKRLLTPGIQSWCRTFDIEFMDFEVTDHIRALAKEERYDELVHIILEPMTKKYKYAQLNENDQNGLSM